MRFCRTQRWQNRRPDLPGWRSRMSTLSELSISPRTTRNHTFTSRWTELNPALYKPGNSPAIITVQGSVEDWTIHNRTLEDHEFHIHQIHFLVLSQDNFETNGSRAEKAVLGQFMDTIQVPYWDGNPKHPYPSVTL